MRTSGTFALTSSRICSSDTLSSRLRCPARDESHRCGRQDDPRFTRTRACSWPTSLPFKELLRGSEDLRIKARILSRRHRPNRSPNDRDDQNLDLRGSHIKPKTNRSIFGSRSFPDYGKLAHLDLGIAIDRARENDEYDKEHIGDFALWKAWDEADGDVKWDSPGDRAGRAGTSSAAPWPRASRRPDRYSLRRRGQYFPASRSRDRANRRLHRQKIRALLDALRAPDGRWTEDVEVARQLLHAARPAGERLHRPRTSLRVDARALSSATQFHLGRNGRIAPGFGPH